MKTRIPIILSRRRRSYGACAVTQEEIIRRLRDDYGIELKRKAVGDDLAVLKDAGYDIVSTGSGSYLNSREFEDPELRMLIDGVLASRYIPASYSADLIKKLCRLSSKYFLPHVKNTYSVNEWSKSENPDIFLNIEIADIAIDAGKQVTFTYNKYGADKKLHKTSEHTVSPYQFILRNQRYYLMAYNEKWQNMGFYRLDRITDMRMTRKPATAIRSVKGYESGIDYRAIATSLPYMFTDKPEYVEFLADAGIIDQIVDWFGDFGGCGHHRSDRRLVRRQRAHRAKRRSCEGRGACKPDGDGVLGDAVLELCGNSLARFPALAHSREPGSRKREVCGAKKTGGMISDGIVCKSEGCVAKAWTRSQR